MAPPSPVTSAPASPRPPGPSRGPGPASHRQGRPAATARLEMDRAFLRSPRGSLKISRTLVALAALFSFVASGSHEAYAALGGMEAGITVLFLLLYLLRLDARIRFLYWPLAVSTDGFKIPELRKAPQSTPDLVTERKRTIPTNPAKFFLRLCSAVSQCPIRDRMIHLLALRNYKKPELLTCLQRERELWKKTRNPLERSFSRVFREHGMNYRGF